MIIDLEKFRLAIRPHRTVLQEEMYACKVDGYPAGLTDVRGLFDEERNRAEVIGVSSTLLEQAGYFHTLVRTSGPEWQVNRDWALKEGLEWGMAERQVAAEAAASRVEVKDNPDFHQSAPWVEMRRVDELAKIGEKVITYVDYPLTEVAWTFHGWNMKIGKPEFINPEANRRADLVLGLIGVSMTVDRMSGPWDFDKKYKPDMRVSWHHKSGGIPEWGGKELFALGIIRSF